MGLLILLQVGLDLGFNAIVALLLIERAKQRTAEDPRMSRGLQLLSSKIAVLQDLMDRSETMGRQLTQMIDRKQQDIQEKVEEVEVHLHKVYSAIEKSEEVAKIFQDKIPHREIIERQTTLKYMQAAKMAHQGFGIDDIAKQVDIPRGELELISKVNRERLLSHEVPPWMSAPKEVQNEPVITQGARELPIPGNSEDSISDSRNATKFEGKIEPKSEPRPEIFQMKSLKFESNIKPVIFRKISSSLPDLG